MVLCKLLRDTHWLYIWPWESLQRNSGPLSAFCCEYCNLCWELRVRCSWSSLSLIQCFSVALSPQHRLPEEQPHPQTDRWGAAGLHFSESVALLSSPLLSSLAPRNHFFLSVARSLSFSVCLPFCLYFFVFVLRPLWFLSQPWIFLCLIISEYTFSLLSFLPSYLLFSVSPDSLDFSAFVSTWSVYISFLPALNFSIYGLFSFLSFSFWSLWFLLLSSPRSISSLYPLAHIKWLVSCDWSPPPLIPTSSLTVACHSKAGFMYPCENTASKAHADGMTRREYKKKKKTFVGHAPRLKLSRLRTFIDWRGQWAHEREGERWDCGGLSLCRHSGRAVNHERCHHRC